MGDVVDFVLDPFDLIDTGGIDGLTGVTAQEDAARRAAGLQAQAGDEAIALQRESLQKFEERVQPFQEFFFGQQPAQTSGQPRMIRTPSGGYRPNMAWSPDTAQTGPMQVQPGSAAEMLQQTIRQDIPAPTFDDMPEIRDPATAVQSPLFQALAEDTTRQIMANRALGGLGGSGGTRRAVTENLGLLGMQLGQQQFGQDVTRRQQAMGETQQGFANTVAQQQNRFNQLMGLLGTAQSSAVGAGTAGLQTGQNVGGLLTDIAAAQAAGEMGAAGAKATGRAGLLGLIGTGVGAAFGGPAGAAIGGSIGGSGAFGLPNPSQRYA